MVFIITNSVDNAFNDMASHLGRHCLLMYHLWDGRLKSVKAAKSVTFDLLILEIFVYFQEYSKNTQI